MDTKADLHKFYNTHEVDWSHLKMPWYVCGQPWRFVRVTDKGIRQRLLESVDTEREATAGALPTRAAEFLRLKVGNITRIFMIMYTYVCILSCKVYVELSLLLPDKQFLRFCLSWRGRWRVCVRRRRWWWYYSCPTGTHTSSDDGTLDTI